MRNADLQELKKAYQAAEQAVRDHEREQEQARVQIAEIVPILIERGFDPEQDDLDAQLARKEGELHDLIEQIHQRLRDGARIAQEHADGGAGEAEPGEGTA